GVLERKRTSGDERGVFAEAVAGDHRWLRTSQAEPKAIRRIAHREHDRLGVDGAAQLLRRPFGDELRHVLLEDGRRRAHDLPNWRGVTVAVEHADRLCSLPGEDHAEIHRALPKDPRTRPTTRPR